MPQRNVHDLQDDDERLSTSQQIHAEALRASDFLGFGEDASDYETDRGEGGYDGDHDRDGRIYPVRAAPFDDTLGQAPDAPTPPGDSASQSASAPPSAPPQSGAPGAKPPSAGPDGERPVWKRPLWIGLGLIGAAALGWWFLGRDEKGELEREREQRRERAKERARLLRQLEDLDDLDEG